MRRVKPCDGVPALCARAPHSSHSKPLFAHASASRVHASRAGPTRSTPSRFSCPQLSAHSPLPRQPALPPSNHGKKTSGDEHPLSGTPCRRTGAGGACCRKRRECCSPVSLTPASPECHAMTCALTNASGMHFSICIVRLLMYCASRCRCTSPAGRRSAPCEAPRGGGLRECRPGAAD